MNGAAWNEEDSSLYLLDGVSNRVRVYGGDGTHRFSFGREGEGPGEFEDVQGGDFFQNNLALTGEALVAVRGTQFVHLFDAEGGFLRRVEQTAPPGGLYFKLNVAPFSDSSFLIAETHALDVGSDRTRMDLRRVPARSGDAEAAEHRIVGSLKNELSRLPNVDDRSPYLGVYDRLWDGLITGLVVTVSLDRHGVCYFGDDLQLVGAHRVDATPVPVDGKRKGRVLAYFRDEYGPEVPMAKDRWENYYDHWPEALPRYTDVVLRSDSTAWLRRPVDETRLLDEPDESTRFAVDVVHARRGYLGSYESTEFPVAFKGKCALFVQTEVPEEAAAEAAADSAFHGLVERCTPR